MLNIFYEYIERNKPLIIGHRGSPRLAKENTLISFRMAFAAGAHGVELDVRFTFDGVPIVYHDDEIPNVGEIARLTLEELNSLCWIEQIEVLTLENFFREMKGKGILNIELKEAVFVHTAVALARDILPPNTYAFSSFIPAVIRECRRLAPGVPALFIYDKTGDLPWMLEKIREMDASGVAPYHKFLDAEAAEFYHRAKLPLFSWTVNEVSEFIRLKNLGVAGIITDTPQEILQAIPPK